jgi:hypothetical protein
VAICTAVLKTEREIGPREVVVDRLGHTDDVDPVVGEPTRDTERVLAADRNQAIEPLSYKRRPHLLDAAILLIGIGPRSAEDRAATMQDAARRIIRQLHRLTTENARPAVAKADELMTTAVDPLANDRTDHRIQPGTITTPGQDSETRHLNPSACR